MLYRFDLFKYSMNVGIEILLVTVVAGLVSLSFSELAIGDWWIPELSWKKVGVLFLVLALVFNAIYFLVIK